MMEPLFAYGTLLDKQVQRAVVGRELSGEPDCLADFGVTALATADGEYPVVFPKSGLVTPGEVLLLTTRELHAIDSYETLSYQRVLRKLLSGRTAWVYEKNNQQQSG